MERKANEHEVPSSQELYDEPERIRIRIREQGWIEKFGGDESATLNDLCKVISKAMSFPLSLQILWPLDTLLPIRPKDSLALTLTLNHFDTYPIYLTGRKTLNSVPPRFLHRSPPNASEHAAAMQVASTLFDTRFSRATQDNSTERTSVHGIRITETFKLQRRFKQLVHMSGPDARDLIDRFDGSGRPVVDAYLGTGIVPRLFCDHICGPLAPSCRSCSVLFVVEWLYFTRHIVSTLNLLFGQQMHARSWDERNATIASHLGECHLDLDELVSRGITVGLECPLAATILNLVESLNIHEYMTAGRCMQDGIVDDIEAFFQILQFLLDVPEG